MAPNNRWPETLQGDVVDQFGIVFPIDGDDTLTPAEEGRIYLQQGVLPDSNYRGCKDAHIIMFGGTIDDGERNQGDYQWIEEGDWDGGFNDNKLILIRFDLLQRVPPGAIVEDAALRLYFIQQRRTSGAYDDNWNEHSTWIHMLLHDWGEGTGDNVDGPQALYGECSWNSAFTGILPWHVPGCRGANDLWPAEDFVTSSTTTYGSVGGIWVEYDLTDFVQYWATHIDRNFGMKISQDDMGTSTSGYVRGAYDFASSEYTTDRMRRPILTVKFRPDPATMVRTWSLYR
jgi:hypothetical protein